MKVATFLFAALGVAAFPYAAHSADPGTPVAEPSWMDGWRGQLGALGIYAPAYEGSSDYEMQPFPFIDVTWRDRVFLSTRDGLGAYAISTKNFRLGGSIGYAPGRDADDVGLGAGIGELDAGVSGQVIARYLNGPLFIGATLARDLVEQDAGFSLTLSGGGVLPLTDEVVLLGGASLELADSHYMDRNFGIGAGDAAAAGISSFDPEGGLKSAGLSLGASYNFTGNWNILILGSYTRLLGDAAESPITQEADQFTFGAGLTYRFGPSPADTAREDMP